MLSFVVSSFSFSSMLATEFDKLLQDCLTICMSSSFWTLADLMPCTSAYILSNFSIKSLSRAIASPVPQIMVMASPLLSTKFKEFKFHVFASCQWLCLEWMCRRVDTIFYASFKGSDPAMHFLSHPHRPWISTPLCPLYWLHLVASKGIDPLCAFLHLVDQKYCVDRTEFNKISAQILLWQQHSQGNNIKRAENLSHLKPRWQLHFWTISPWELQQLQQNPYVLHCSLL